MKYFDSLRLDLTYDQAVRKVRDALAHEGFGVITEIDVQATMREKLGEQMERYVILGACNPQLAHRALQVDRTLGLLLPCNVVVREVDGGSVVEFLDPQIMISVPDRDELAPVAGDAARALTAVRETLAG